MHVLTKPSVRVVNGAAECQSKLSSIIGSQVTNVIGLSLSVMARNLALYIRLVGIDLYRAEKGWYGRKKIGLMSKILPTGQ
jgi:hypothetical protein